MAQFERLTDKLVTSAIEGTALLDLGPRLRAQLELVETLPLIQPTANLFRPFGGIT